MVPEKLAALILSNRNGIGETMFHWYAIEGELNVVRKILEMGFDVNTQNEFGKTPLFECVVIERWDMVEMLLANGADLSVKDHNDEDIWEYLAYFEYEAQIQRLRELTESR